MARVTVSSGKLNNSDLHISTVFQVVNCGKGHNCIGETELTKKRF